jgi:hypothetical protein
MESDAQKLARLDADMAVLKANAYSHEALCNGRWRAVRALTVVVSGFVAVIVSLVIALVGG